MGKQLITTEHRIGFSATALVTSEVKEWSDGSQTIRNRKSLENLKDNRTKGLISKASKTKMKKAINWLVISSTKKQLYSMKLNQKFKFKVNFITLTIPPQELKQVNERTFKQLLNTWLTYHRKYSKLNNYVWKVELHKDGRLHCHIVSDTFIHHSSARKSWNTILLRASLLECHFKKFGNYSPPSTEIKSVKKIKNLAAYMVKYMCKSNAENPLWSGRVWSCSLKLSKVVNSALYISPEKIGGILHPIVSSSIKHMAIETPKDAFGRSFEVAQIYFLRVKDWINLQGTYIFEYFKELILFLRGSSSKYRQTELIYHI